MSINSTYKKILTIYKKPAFLDYYCKHSCGCFGKYSCWSLNQKSPRK